MGPRKIGEVISALIGFSLGLFVAANLYAEVKIAVIDSGANGQFYQSLSFTSLAANVDPLGHGSKIAQLISESNPQAKICVLQVCEKINGHYLPSSQAVLEAIQWCVENNIDIVNLSLVLPYEQQIEQAIKEAYYKKGIIFIAAAGNQNSFSQFALNADGYVYLAKHKEQAKFPASSDCVISVGAVDARGNSVDYSVKEADVFSQGSFGNLKGTSFACARISAEAAKILAINPEISLEELKKSLTLLHSTF